MFTGLIKDIGTVVKAKENETGILFTIRTKLANEIEIDDSVATNGVCLTVIDKDDCSFSAQAIHVTLEKTTLGTLDVGSRVNLECALRLSDRLGGHLVQGHVSGTAGLTDVIKRGENYELGFECEKKFFKYMITEGSIAIEGISLTLAKVESFSKFWVSIIPHTWENTNLALKKIGDLVNIEVDMMAKYLENFQHFENQSTRS